MKKCLSILFFTMFLFGIGQSTDAKRVLYIYDGRQGNWGDRINGVVMGTVA